MGLKSGEYGRVGRVSGRLRLRGPRGLPRIVALARLSRMTTSPCCSVGAKPLALIHAKKHLAIQRALKKAKEAQGPLRRMPEMSVLRLIVSQRDVRHQSLVLRAPGRAHASSAWGAPLSSTKTSLLTGSAARGSCQRALFSGHVGPVFVRAANRGFYFIPPTQLPQPIKSMVRGPKGADPCVRPTRPVWRRAARTAAAGATDSDAQAHLQL